jgi:hypothetical protein
LIYDLRKLSISKISSREIKPIESKKIHIEKMKKLNDDEDFNLARELAFDSICYVTNRLEKDLNSL